VGWLGPGSNGAAAAAPPAAGCARFRPTLGALRRRGIRRTLGRCRAFPGSAVL
jgi:hypothetical protein